MESCDYCNEEASVHSVFFRLTSNQLLGVCIITCHIFYCFLIDVSTQMLNYVSVVYMYRTSQKGTSMS